MPIYEYRCSEGHEYERWQEITAPAADTCEVCGNPAHRVISAASINVGAIIKPGDIRIEPRIRDYLGHRHWRQKQDAKQAAERLARKPVTSYRSGPGHGGTTDSD